MKLSYAAFELAVDRLLSNAGGRKARSVYDLPQRDLLRAYHEGLSPEDFSSSLQTESQPAPVSSESPDQSSLF
jgi:hypothetical protein